MTPHKIHAGKNEPRRLKEGAREHPVFISVTPVEAAATLLLITRRGPAEFDLLVALWPFCMKQVSSLEG
jgi:hypothetical protein